VLWKKFSTNYKVIDLEKPREDQKTLENGDKFVREAQGNEGMNGQQVKFDKYLQGKVKTRDGQVANSSEAYQTGKHNSRTLNQVDAEGIMNDVDIHPLARLPHRVGI
jgi:hypothetical protein